MTCPEPQLIRFGTGGRLVIVDQASGAVAVLRRQAAALAPFPPAAHHYPGLRRILDERDGDAWAAVCALVQNVTPFIAGAFDCDTIELVEASFSIVTEHPDLLSPPQRAPHFDGIDPDLIAMVHYLADIPDTGTAFFRHRATGIDQLTAVNVASYTPIAQREAIGTTGYVQGSNVHYDLLYFVEARPDRLLIYPGSLLHSGLIPPEMPLDPDPLKGRLTANYFLKLTR